MKKFEISENVLELLLEQVSLQPKTTSEFIRSVVLNDVKPIENQKEEIDNGEEKD